MASDSETLPLRSGEDIVKARQTVRARAIALGFSLLEQTKIVTAASELARNTVTYGGGGELRIKQVQHGTRPGLQLVFEDHGPGIPDVDLAMKDGYTTGSGLGLGLSGARKLSHEFTLNTEVGRGTTVTITRWK